jgi:TRAP-type transport system small permease protein
MVQFVACVDWLERKIVIVESILLRALVAIAFCLTFSQVICRYLLDNPLIWTEEFVLYLFVWIVMVGAAAALRTQGHFSLGTFVQQLPPRIVSTISLFVDLAIALFAMVLLVHGTHMTIAGFNEQASSFSLPMSCFYLALPAGGALMLWHIFVRVLHSFCDDTGLSVAAPETI